MTERERQAQAIVEAIAELIHAVIDDPLGEGSSGREAKRKLAAALVIALVF